MDNRRLRVWLCMLGLACIGILLVVALSTPLKHTRGVENVTLSVPSGFYSDAFDLELKANARIYYTLDSSLPDENSTLYTGPIHIDDASMHENVYSMNTDVSVGFYEDMLEEAGITMRYGIKVPDTLVDKATVVRAVCIGDNGIRSEIVNGIYFVGFNEKSGYDGVYVVSITTDPSNLFDYDAGIYVTGAVFENSLVDGKISAPASQDISILPGNYHQKGPEWEREAYVCIFDEDRDIVLSGNFGLCLQGNSSRGRLPKGLNILAKKQYGATSIDASPIFGENNLLGSLNLQPVVQSLNSKMNDRIANDCAEGLDISSRPYIPCELFLDGEYWGVYWLVPRFEKEYFRNHYGIYPDNVAKIKVSPQSVDSEEDLQMYMEMTEFICENDMSDPEKFEKACELIDLQSCIDYYAFEIYIGNEDWPIQNTSLWRTREVANGPQADCRWRWIIYDLNWCMKAHNARTDFVMRTIRWDPLFASMMRNPEFESALYAKLVELAEINFNPLKIREYITEYENLMLEPLLNEFKRFYGGERTEEDFMISCESIYDFFRDRAEYIKQTYGVKGGQADRGE